jgi:glycosyltransferase involved in cell wall biosynthesis
MNGLLVPPRDAGALAACLETLYKDEDLRNSLSQQALKESERYSPEKIASQYMELYREVLAKELPLQKRTRNTPEK